MIIIFKTTHEQNLIVAAHSKLRNYKCFDSKEGINNTAHFRSKGVDPKVTLNNKRTII